MGKIGQIYEHLLPNMSEIGMFQCSEVEEQGLSQLLSCRYRSRHSRFRFWTRVRPVLFYSYFSARPGRKSRRKLDYIGSILEGMAEADIYCIEWLFVVLVQDVQASCLSPRSYVSNKAFRKLLLSKLYHKNVVCVVADEAHCNIDW